MYMPSFRKQKEGEPGGGHRCRRGIEKGEEDWSNKDGDGARRGGYNLGAFCCSSSRREQAKNGLYSSHAVQRQRRRGGNGRRARALSVSSPHARTQKRSGEARAAVDDVRRERAGGETRAPATRKEDGHARPRHAQNKPTQTGRARAGERERTRYVEEKHASESKREGVFSMAKEKRRRAGADGGDGRQARKRPRKQEGGFAAARASAGRGEEGHPPRAPRARRSQQRRCLFACRRGIGGRGDGEDTNKQTGG